MIDLTPHAFRKIPFIVPGEPNQKRSAHPRAIEVNRGGKTFHMGVATKHPKNKGVEANIQHWCFEAGWIPGSTPYDGPVILKVISYFSVLRSTPRWQLPLFEDEKILHTKKPDIDRLTNMVQDALTGVVWADDSQICRDGGSGKWYSPRPRMEVTIWLIKKQLPASAAEYKQMMEATGNGNSK